VPHGLQLFLRLVRVEQWWGKRWAWR